jgi:hypothetical protein
MLRIVRVPAALDNFFQPLVSAFLTLIASRTSRKRPPEPFLVGKALSALFRASLGRLGP